MKSLLISYNLPFSLAQKRRLKILSRSAARVSRVHRSSLANSVGSYIFLLNIVFSLAKKLQLVLKIIATYILVSYLLADY